MYLRDQYESDMPAPAISVLEMDSVEAANAALAELPIMKAGFLDPEDYPLRPLRHWEVPFHDDEKTT